MRVMALDRAQKVIAHYADLVNQEDEENVVVDMLADIIQWCAYRNVGFYEALGTAELHADAEMRGDD